MTNLSIILLCIVVCFIIGFLVTFIYLKVKNSKRKIGNLIITKDEEGPYLYLEITAKDFSEISSKKEVILIVKDVSHK